MAASLLPSACNWCPRSCGANRAAAERGVCGADDALLVARAALHFWEEPPISGDAGSGTVFFSNCSLHCSYCQNADIAAGRAGAAVTVERLAAIFHELAAQGALNINLVTATHYLQQVVAAVRRARSEGLALPAVWNTSGYETVAAIRALAGTVDVYLTDFKYAYAATAARYSHAPDYPEVALAAIDEMVRQTGPCEYDEVDGQERLVRGVVVRHLMLPGCEEESLSVVRLLHERYGNQVRLSLMNQYTPVLAPESLVARRCPELLCRVSDDSYERLLDFADELGIDDYFWQDGPASEESFIPPFDLTGV